MQVISGNGKAGLAADVGRENQPHQFTGIVEQGAAGGTGGAVVAGVDGGVVVEGEVGFQHFACRNHQVVALRVAQHVHGVAVADESGLRHVFAGCADDFQHAGIAALVGGNAAGTQPFAGGRVFDGDFFGIGDDVAVGQYAIAGDLYPRARADAAVALEGVDAVGGARGFDVIQRNALCRDAEASA